MSNSADFLLVKLRTLGFRKVLGAFWLPFCYT